jgi:hypothetical protein
MANFKNHRQLKIKKWEYKALIAVMKVLPSIPHANTEDEHSDKTDLAFFDMSLPIFRTSCGTSACIGGWVALSKSKDECWVDTYVVLDRSDALEELFFPLHDVDVPYFQITPLQGAKAIENFLTDGDPHWSSVLAPVE